MTTSPNFLRLEFQANQVRLAKAGTALGQGPHFALTCAVLWPVLSSDLVPTHGGSWSRAWLQVNPGQLAKTWGPQGSEGR